MGVRDNIHLFTHVTESADSSSSCPASSNSDESVPEGYLILTFDRSKRAKLKTAVFADVSNCHFTDDFDDDNFCDDEADSTCDWPVNETSLASTGHSTCVAPVNGKDASVTSNGGDVTAPHSLSEKQNPPSDCYGEVVWVGETNASEQVLQSPTKMACVKPVDFKSVQVSESHCLIRTSPIARSASTGPQIIRTIRVPQASISSTTPSPTATLAAAPSSNGIHMRHLPLSVRFENKSSAKYPPSPWSHLSLNGSARNRFTSFSCSHADDLELGNGKYPRKMLRCDACGKYYRNEYSLHHHICLKRKDVWKKGDVPSEVVDGQLIYYCPTCHKPFKWLGNLTRHFYVHTGQRFFKCDICSKEFFSAYQVKRHMNSHTGRRFKCEVCEKPFTCKYACAWHTRQHYSCVE